MCMESPTTPIFAEPPPRPPIPPRYRVVRPLGRGGQATVFLVEDRFRGNARLALKTVRDEVAAERRIAGVQAEFLLLGRLVHPNLARVRDFGLLHDAAGGPPRGAYFTSDFIRGPNLLDWAAGLPPGPRWRSILAFAFEALSALRYLDSKGIAHGDIKPANLLVQEEPREGGSRPRLRLIDFGVARLGDGIATGGGGTRAYLPPPPSLVAGGGSIVPDLYALGLSLFHAGVGRLPFAVGDRSSQEAWWASGRPAVPSDLAPEAPRAADDLIARLTSLERGRRFQSAAEAYDTLRRLVTPPPPLRPTTDTDADAWPAEREEWVLRLLDRLLSPGSRRVVHIVSGPRGNGKTRALEALSGRLQVRGVPVLSFEGPDDPRPLSRASLLLLERGIPPSEKSGDPGSLIPHLRRLGVAVIVEEAPLGEKAVDGAPGLRDAGASSDPGARTFLKLWARAVLAPSSLERPPTLVCAEAETGRIREALDLPTDAVAAQPLEPLSPESIAEMGRDFFGVESFPEKWALRVEEESGGLSDGVVECLRRLGAAGMGSSVLGELVAPKDLPRRILPRTRARTRIAGGSLPDSLRRALGLVVIAGEPLSAEEVASRFPENAADGWHECLERLRTRGCVRLAETDGIPRYRIAGGGIEAKADALLGKAGTRAARRLLERFFAAARAAGAPLSADTLQASARNALSLGDVGRAALAALAARRRLLATHREIEALALVEEVRARFRRTRVERPGRGIGRRGDRLAPLLALRHAEILLRLGRHREGLEVLRGDAMPGRPPRRPLRRRRPGRPPAEPPHEPPHESLWARRLEGRFRAEALETLGEPSSAIAELEPIVDPLLRKTATGTDLFALEAAARLVPLYFRAGRPDDARACLDLGRALALSGSRLEPQAYRAARVLAFFARAESTHGRREDALTLLGESLRLARGLRRDDFAWATLNELGILYAGSQRVADAARTFEEAAARAQRSGDRLGQVKTIFNLAVLRYRSDELDEAEGLFRKAGRLAGPSVYGPLTAALWIAHAGVLRERGKLIEALRLYRKVIRFADLAGPSEQTVAHNNLAELYLTLGSLRRASLSAFVACRMARRMGDRFRAGLTLRARGMVRRCAGELGTARRDLEKALEAAGVEGDVRGQGIALHHLGLLALLEEDHDAAIRFLRRGMTASRGSNDRRYLEASRTELLAELARRGRKAGVRRILARLGPGSGHSLRSRVLSLEVGDGWPASAGRAVEAAMAAEREGRVWECFCVLRDIERHATIHRGVREAVALRVDLLSARILRRLSPRRAARFRDAWGLRGEEADGAAPESERVDEEARARGRAAGAPGAGTDPPGDESGRGPVVGARASSASAEGLPAAIVGDLRRSFGLKGAWVIDDPRREPGLAPGGLRPPAAKLRGLLARHGVSLERVRRTRRASWEPPHVFVPLSHPEWARVLCLEVPDGSWSSLVAQVARLEDKVHCLSLSLRLLDLEAALRTTRDLHSEARDEVHRLNALLARDAGELETELSTRSLENLNLQREGGGPTAARRPSRRQPVGRSPAMRSLLSRLPRIATGDLPVLIVGESGVGKDLLARAIHDLSLRRDRPFLAEICNVPSSLVETELFGYVRGAFTGAERDRQGVFQRVEGGTIYLDEIGDIPEPLQVRLLRVLAEKRVRPVGSEESVPVDFRLISSSRHDVGHLRAAGRIRQDFLYRINAEVLEIPPLRDRKEDIPDLVDAFLADHARESGRPVPYLHRGALEQLTEHPWPGNVRELENVLRSILAAHPLEISEETVRAVRTMPRGVAGSPPSPTSATVDGFLHARERWECEAIHSALRSSEGNATRAARSLRISRRYLGTLLGKHGIRLEELRRRGDSAPSAESPPARRAGGRGREKDGREDRVPAPKGARSQRRAREPRPEE